MLSSILIIISGVTITSLLILVLWNELKTLREYCKFNIYMIMHWVIVILVTLRMIWTTINFGRSASADSIDLIFTVVYQAIEEVFMDSTHSWEFDADFEESRNKLKTIETLRAKCIIADQLVEDYQRHHYGKLETEYAAVLKLYADYQEATGEMWWSAMNPSPNVEAALNDYIVATERAWPTEWALANDPNCMDEYRKVVCAQRWIYEGRIAKIPPYKTSANLLAEMDARIEWEKQVSKMVVITALVSLNFIGLFFVMYCNS